MSEFDQELVDAIEDIGPEDAPFMRPSLNVHQRIAKVMEEVTFIQKDKPKGLQYAVVSHDAVTAKVRPVMLKYGLIAVPVNLKYKTEGNRCELSGAMRFINVDRPEDYLDVESLGFGVDTQDKAAGKSLTYLCKMGILKGLMLESGLGMDPDYDQKTEFKTETPELAPDGTPVPSLDYALKACAMSVRVIKDGIAVGDLATASESWQELTGGEKVALWVAPTKGGPFSTDERTIIKSAEFRQAHFGEDNA